MVENIIKLSDSRKVREMGNPLTFFIENGMVKAPAQSGKEFEAEFMKGLANKKTQSAVAVKQKAYRFAFKKGLVQVLHAAIVSKKFLPAYFVLKLVGEGKIDRSKYFSISSDILNARFNSLAEDIVYWNELSAAMGEKTPERLVFEVEIVNDDDDSPHKDEDRRPNYKDADGEIIIMSRLQQEHHQNLALIMYFLDHSPTTQVFRGADNPSVLMSHYLQQFINAVKYKAESATVTTLLKSAALLKDSLELYLLTMNEELPQLKDKMKLEAA